MINFLEFLFVHGFLLSYFGFLLAWDFHCMYILPQSFSENDAESSIAHAAVVTPEQVKKNHEAVREVVYKQSTLTDEQNAFFDNFMSDLGDVVGITDEDECLDTELTHVPEDDLLTMETWGNATPPVEISEEFTATASAKIDDCVLGEQIWTVEVIGEEQGYIHVSDGTKRAWINATRFNHFALGDILSVLVDRKTEICVELMDATILQRYSMEFSLSDNIFTEENESQTESEAC